MWVIGIIQRLESGQWDRGYEEELEGTVSASERNHLNCATHFVPSVPKGEIGQRINDSPRFLRTGLAQMPNTCTRNQNEERQIHSMSDSSGKEACRPRQENKGPFH